MNPKLQSFFRFLPIQLLLLHFRKYQLLLIFWVVLFATIANQFAVSFGAVSLFLAPEYFGSVSLISFYFLGGATATYSMSWHITTFIIHSKRLPFLGATRQAFLKYTTNNSIIPVVYLIVFGILAARFLSLNEGLKGAEILIHLSGFYLGYISILVISFAYFFRLDRNLIKIALSKIAQTSAIRGMIPYDNLDREHDVIKAESYIDNRFRLKKIISPYHFNPRLLVLILRRHHRNAIFAIIFALIILMVLGWFMDNPVLRIPAAAGFLLLFTVMMAGVGAFIYFLRSWVTIGWIAVVSILSLLTYFKIFDIRGIAYGLDYSSEKKQVYNYENLIEIFNDSLYVADKQQEIERMNNWLIDRKEDGKKPPLIFISTSGGGSRAAYWTFRCLQVADSMSNGDLFKYTNVISGASGGMIGAAYWRSVNLEKITNQIEDLHDFKYQDNIGKNLLNAIVFSFASVDFISPFNKITIAGKRDTRDRGLAFDNELSDITEGLLEKKLHEFSSHEKEGRLPLLIISGTILNDGRKLIISTQPVSYLTRPSIDLNKDYPMIDGIDYSKFFENQNAQDIKLTTALRMSASFPIILPVVKLPSNPSMNIIDAGLRDNFGIENNIRYLSTFKEWIGEHIGDIIFIKIRDTKENDPTVSQKKNTLMTMLMDPIFGIQKRWSAFQTYHQSYVEDILRHNFPNNEFHEITFSYIPKDKEKTAALNFHLTQKEKIDLLMSIYNTDNMKSFSLLQELLNNPNND